MTELHFEKLSRFDRVGEPCTVAVPFVEGRLTDASRAAVCDGSRALPTQCHTTAAWPDDSVKWLLVHFLADLPGNEGKTFRLETGTGPSPVPPDPVTVETADGICTLKTSGLRVDLQGSGRQGLFRRISSADVTLEAKTIVGPVVTDAEGNVFAASIASEGWQVIEPGPVRVVVEANGKHVGEDGSGRLDFTARVSAFAGKPWIQLDYRIVHRETSSELTLESMKLALNPLGTDPTKVRTALTTSNYSSNIRHSSEGEELRHLIDAEQLLYEGNEQIPETLYGTFWADWNDPERGGVCVTIHQAQQNFPKALVVGGSGIDVRLLPAGGDGLTLIQGMAKTHRLFLHFHGPAQSLEDLNVRSLQFQMPDRPTLLPRVHREAGVFENVWVERPVPRVERRLIDLADNRTRGYGILHWGDGPDAGYSDQGRGKGELVWTNNEYDLPHAAMLMYARTGERRFLDYMLVAARHWMDVDVCHHSDDALRRGGQIIHSARHATAGVTLSHEWVEGLLDYYHQTGEEFARRTAIGIGENVLRHLERPVFRRSAGTSARETGWALRTLVALFRETHDEKWMAPAEFIVKQFDDWQRQYGAWVSPYTDHTLVRVPFMIAVAANSLMRYYRVRPEPCVAEMIVAAVRDMIEHCLMSDGRFYYKELPSLQRRGAGALVLEALANAYEISGDVSLLEAGMTTFEITLRERSSGGYHGSKFRAGDAVIWPNGPGPKAFAASFGALMPFYRAVVGAGLLD